MTYRTAITPANYYLRTVLVRVIDPEHTTYTSEALSIARTAAANGNTPFGSLLVRNGEALERSENTTRTDADITAHPELKLARWAAQELDAEARGEVTMYTSTEPCPMCAGAICLSGLGRVVYSVNVETAAEFAPAGESVPSSTLLVRSDVEVIGGVLETEGRAVHRDCRDDG